MLTPFQKFQLHRLQKKFGILTVNEALELAIQAENFASNNSFDPAYSKFKKDQHDLFEYANILEKLS